MAVKVSKLASLSVFFPAYNEGANIVKTVLGAKRVLPKVAERWEIIVVDDGSSDDTSLKVMDLAKKEKQVKLIRHKVNMGYGAALRTGLYNSRYEWIAFTDSDGQFEFGEITKFIKKQEETGAKLIIGYYKKRKVPFYRKLNTFLWEMFVYVLFRFRVRDIDCAFKLINKEVIETIPKLKSGRGAFISSEFLIKVNKSGFAMEEVGVTHYARASGSGTGANIDVIMQSFIDLFKLWRKLR